MSSYIGIVLYRCIRYIIQTPANYLLFTVFPSIKCYLDPTLWSYAHPFNGKMEQFKRALAINLGGHKYCAPLLESTGLCQGIWFVDLISARSTLSVLVKSAPDETAALYQMSMTEENMRSFVSVMVLWSQYSHDSVS